MNRIVVGAVAALLLVAAGLFWWQGRAEVAHGVLPPDISASGTGDGSILLPSADPNHGRGGDGIGARHVGCLRSGQRVAGAWWVGARCRGPR